MISLIVPVYNESARLPGLLRCLRAQNAPAGAFEAVFADDGSTDDSLSLLRAAQEREAFPIRILSRPNSGVSAARNAGLEAAQGEYVAFADADDLLAPNYVQVLSLCAQAQPDVLRFSFTRVPAQAEQLPPAQGVLPERADRDDLLRQFLADPKLFGPYGFLFRRDFLMQNDLRFAEGRAYYEDYDLIVRAVACAQDLYEMPCVLYGYRQAEGSAMMRFNAQRVQCLELADPLCAFLAEKKLPCAAQFQKWYKARLYWAVLWQACMALPSPGDARRFARLTGGRKMLRSLALYPSRKVAATALLGALCPEAYAMLAKKLGRGRSFLQEMSREEADALLRSLAPAGRAPSVPG
ncbi:MAG: glycosyltransferase family A protein [Eubacteriales bacterium]|nr:glycosyltransferase family A protein [Eubacteriales bacterium]